MLPAQIKEVGCAFFPCWYVNIMLTQV